MLTDVQREQFKILNAEMREFKRNHVKTPNKIREYQVVIQQIYKEAGINLKRDMTFSVNKKLPPEVEKQLVDLSEKMLKDKDVAFYEDYKEIQRQGKFEKFGLTSLNDIIEGLDAIQQYHSDAEVETMLTSDQFVETFIYGRNKKGFNPDDVSQLAALEYSLSGARSDTLQKKMFEAVEEYETISETRAQLKRGNRKKKRTLF